MAPMSGVDARARRSTVGAFRAMRLAYISILLDMLVRIADFARGRAFAYHYAHHRRRAGELADAVSVEESAFFKGVSATCPTPGIAGC
jgi:hypothetical protein